MRGKLFTLFLMVGLVLGTVGMSQAVQVDATITADNYYAVYSGNETGVSYIGRNELGTTGSEGAYNWSVPESYIFDVADGDYIYIAAWSDASVTQAWLGEFDFGGQTLLTNATDWEVFLTYEEPNYVNGDPAPTVDSVVANVIEANAAGWGSIYETRDNGAVPWGSIAAISADADWIWGSQILAAGEGEYQLFRTQVGTAPVPEPSTILLLGSGLAGLAFYRRKRK